MFINKIRLKWLDTVREHVILEINMKNLYKVFVLCAKISFVKNM